MRNCLSILALLGLAACAPEVPDSGAGVGFGDYDAFRAQQAAREAQLSAPAALPSPRAVSTETLSATAPGSTGLPTAPVPSGSDAPTDEAERLAAATAAALNSGRQPLEASPSNPPPAVVNSAGISEETNFDAVSAQRSIQDDAARRAALAAQYQVIQPTAVPTRPGNAGPNIVDYALSTTNSPGQQVHRRINIASAQRYAANCAKYPSPDLAQQDFLSRGGPRTDRLGLDPDGDGFACSWDPSPFRRARGG